MTRRGAAENSSAITTAAAGWPKAGPAGLRGPIGMHSDVISRHIAVRAVHGLAWTQQALRGGTEKQMST